MTTIYTSLESFIKCTADFRVMSLAEQCSLFQRNMKGLLGFYCTFVFRESGVFHNQTTQNALLPLYGVSSVQKTKCITEQLDFDLVLVKLMLMTLAFSSNCFVVHEGDHAVRDGLLCGTFRLLGSQNVYAELLWRYMTYRYGFYESARRFNALIKVALDLLQLTSTIYDNNRVHQTFADQISEQSARTLTLNNNDDTPLWGRS
jgi:hypothetical protein